MPPTGLLWTFYVVQWFGQGSTFIERWISITNKGFHPLIHHFRGSSTNEREVGSMSIKLARGHNCLASSQSYRTFLTSQSVEMSNLRCAFRSSCTDNIPSDKFECSWVSFAMLQCAEHLLHTIGCPRPSHTSLSKLVKSSRKFVGLRTFSTRLRSSQSKYFVGDNHTLQGWLPRVTNMHPMSTLSSLAMRGLCK